MGWGCMYIVYSSNQYFDLARGESGIERVCESLRPNKFSLFVPLKT